MLIINRNIQKEKGYSSLSSNLPVTHGNFDNGSISSFEFGFIISRLDKVSYIYVPLCFPQTYPYCINHHSGLAIFETSNAG